MNELFETPKEITAKGFEESLSLIEDFLAHPETPGESFGVDHPTEVINKVALDDTQQTKKMITIAYKIAILLIGGLIAILLAKYIHGLR